MIVNVTKFSLIKINIIKKLFFAKFLFEIESKSPKPLVITNPMFTPIYSIFIFENI